MLCDLDTYLGAPVGRAVAGPDAFVWFAGPKLRVIRAWGTLQRATLDFAVRVTRHEVAPGFPGFGSLIDVRGLRGAAPDAYLRAIERGHAIGADWESVLEGSALVHDGGFATVAAAAIAGYTTQLGIEIAVTMCTDVASALAALGVTADAAALEDGLVARRAAVEAQALLVERARAWIADHLRAASVAACAVALGVSARSLQRGLRDARMRLVAARRAHRRPGGGPAHPEPPRPAHDAAQAGARSRPPQQDFDFGA